MTMTETTYHDAPGHGTSTLGAVFDTEADTVWLRSTGLGCELSRDDVADLVRRLTEWLQSDLETPTGCDREKCCGDVDGCSPVAQPAQGYAPPPTITDEAQQLVYGSRQDQYDHPRRNLTRTAILWHGVLMDKLADGESITPEDVALCMVQVKVAREVHRPARDNRVDGTGYFLCLDRLETGQ